nr:immunoglobulin heavy chain junction region [Mus musculus]
CARGERLRLYWYFDVW